VVVPSQTEAPLWSNCPLFFGGWLKFKSRQPLEWPTLYALSKGWDALNLDRSVCNPSLISVRMVEHESQLPIKKIWIQPNRYHNNVVRLSLRVSLPVSLLLSRTNQITSCHAYEECIPISLSSSLSPLSSSAPFYSSFILFTLEEISPVVATLRKTTRGHTRWPRASSLHYPRSQPPGPIAFDPFTIF